MPIAQLISFLGIRGIVAVVLAVILGVQTLQVKVLKSNITELEKDAKVQSEKIGRIESERDSLLFQISEADAKNKTLQNALAVVDDRNKMIRLTNGKLKEELMKKQVPQDCIAAVIELKQQTQNNAKKWNGSK